jgi:DNA-binding MarR family transcriptional regulator
VRRAKPADILIGRYIKRFGVLDGWKEIVEMYSKSEIHILLMFNDLEELTATEIAERTELDATGVTNILKVLYQKGLVRYKDYKRKERRRIWYIPIVTE